MTIIDGDEVVGRKYAWETKPRPVYAIQWRGDNWEEMRSFLRRYTQGWTASVWNTYGDECLIERHSGGSDFLLNRDEWLIVYSWDNDGTTGWDPDMIEGYTKKFL